MAGGKYIGVWGAFGGSPQKGVTQYTMAANRQKPLAGFGAEGVFNTVRRLRGQVLYVVPPFIALYFILDWANKRNEFLNSKAGRALYAEEEE